MSEAQIDRAGLPIPDPPRRPVDVLDATSLPRARPIGIWSMGAATAWSPTTFRRCGVTSPCGGCHTATTH